MRRQIGSRSEAGAMSESLGIPRMPSPPKGYLELPATADNLRKFPAKLRAIHTEIRRAAARTRAPGDAQVADEVSALIGIPITPSQVKEVRRLYSDHQWTEKLPRRPMDLRHRSAPVAIRVEDLA